MKYLINTFKKIYIIIDLFYKNIIYLLMYHYIKKKKKKGEIQYIHIFNVFYLIII